ncbi:MAG: hypothetical protein IPJ20_18195 [Flammeovirgaceae bacterium]|nr:hypothetical protein [Flammeovirgaceae bacterium]
MNPVFAQDKHHYQTDFTPSDFAERRTKIFDAIGTNAIAVIQGASGVPGLASLGKQIHSITSPE